MWSTAEVEAEDEDEAAEVQAAVNRCPLATCEVNVDHTEGARLHGIGFYASAIKPVGLAGCSNRGGQTSSAGGNVLRGRQRGTHHTGSGTRVWHMGMAWGSVALGQRCTDSAQERAVQSDGVWVRHTETRGRTE